MCDSFEARELYAIRWIERKDNIADGLTKHNQSLCNELNQLLAEGLWSHKLYDEGAL